ncbi:sensor domain-containing phosphodiesterase [Methylophaga sp. UBA3996]|uniref:sensor domain-containing phosphodiesterase n=1 Tax=Methylophaga sp. UBA3996 TaxID=1946891 RepID=UPI0025A07833|nr:EAL domain-containing protein [Methylophaga sp. UBA3996]
MRDTILQGLESEIALSETSEITSNLSYILSVIRKHLDMDVAFISEITDDMRKIEIVDTAYPDSPLPPGHADPTEHTYCQRIIEGELNEVIQDTSKNHITKVMPITEELQIGSYLGAPIVLNDGEVYGTFCCFSHTPNDSLNERDLALMKIFADIAARHIDKQLHKNQEDNQIKKRITEVLNNHEVKTVFQPVFHVDQQKVIGYECLSRFTSTPYLTPDIWFQQAESVGLGEELEIMAIEAAIDKMSAFSNDTSFSLNISPEYVINGAVERALTQHILDKKIVLEVTEHAQITDYRAFRNAVESLRNQGVRLAIDDVGAGYSNFQHILELGADIIKLDISLIRNIDTDTSRKALTAALIAYAKETACEVLAEGVETQEEFHELVRLGINKIQGYFISQPLELEQAIHFQCPEFN